MRFSLTRMIIISLFLGGIGGALIAQVPSSVLSTPLSVLLGALYGLLFALFARRIASVGSGLIWGLGYAFLLCWRSQQGSFHCCRVQHAWEC